MSVLVDANTRLLVQGITGKSGSFHASACKEYGTRVVAGVTPARGGEKFENTVPIFDTVAEAVDATQANASMIFVPPEFAGDAILEAADAGIQLIVAITEGIPVMDMMRVRHALEEYSCVLIGPNCPGIITPGACKIGIMPGYIHRPGNVGVVSRSGTLTYEAVWQITSQGLGQSTCIGVGGDPIHGLTLQKAVEYLHADPDTHAIVMIGEIGGGMEAEAAKWIKADGNRKPVVGFIAGQTAPKGRRMGHAGAIIGGADDTAEAKMKIMMECGIHVVYSPADIGETMIKALAAK
ncbi:MAG: succinate--CoA ligase subunit alpha [Cytophagia bacterium]|nr:succinate--CoA ligase subunit alpha [Cytophagia bacterium]